MTKAERKLKELCDAAVGIGMKCRLWRSRKGTPIATFDNTYCNVVFLGRTKVYRLFIPIKGSDEKRRVDIKRPEDVINFILKEINENDWRED